jgi:hypothetical protein
MASSSRSQVADLTAWAVVSLTCKAPSVGVCCRPSLAMAIVTHLVTHPPHVLGGLASQPEKRKVGGSTPPLTTHSHQRICWLTCGNLLVDGLAAAAL